MPVFASEASFCKNSKGLLARSANKEKAPTSFCKNSEDKKRASEQPLVLAHSHMSSLNVTQTTVRSDPNSKQQQQQLSWLLHMHHDNNRTLIHHRHTPTIIPTIYYLIYADNNNIYNVFNQQS